MSTETRQEILDTIDEICFALGQKDWDELCSTAYKASVLFATLAKLSRDLSELSSQDLIAAIDRIPIPEQEQALRMLRGLQDYLPTFGKTIVAAATQVFPQDQGGRPQSFSDRESMRNACNLVLEFIAKGRSEADAKKLAAGRLRVSPQTINRLWKKRTEIAAEPSIEEFFQGFLRSLFTPKTSEATKTESPCEYQQTSLMQSK